MGLTEAGRAAITDRGFQFLLDDAFHQLWTLLREYIRGAEHGSGAAPWLYNEREHYLPWLIFVLSFTIMAPCPTVLCSGWAAAL